MTNIAPSATIGIASESPARQDSRGSSIRKLGSAAKMVGGMITSTPEAVDSAGGYVPGRKQVYNRLDQELENRGSIFSGRDEK